MSFRPAPVALARRSLRRRHTRSGRDSKEGLDSNDVTSRLAAGLEASGHVRAAPGGERLDGWRWARRGRRRAVFAKTGYTMSGGIAHNKMLAKLASARNKPNKQTVVSRAAVDEMLEILPMPDQRAGVSSASAERAGERFAEEDGEGNAPGDGTASGASRSAAERRARSGTGRGSSYEGGFTAASLRALFSNENARKRNQTSSGLDDKTFAWLERASRGEDADPVVANVRDGAKSVTAFKSFKPVFEKARAHTWLKVLALELAERLAEDRRRFSRTPRTVRLEWRAEPNARAVPPRESFETRSKTFAFPADASAALGSGNTPRAGEALTHAATRVFDALGPEATSPCTRRARGERLRARPRRARRWHRAVLCVGRKAARLLSSNRRNGDERNAKNASLASVGAVPKARFEKMRAALTPAARRRRAAPNRRRRFRKPSESASADKVCAAARSRRARGVSPLRLADRPGSDAQSHADEHLAFDLSKSEPQHRSAGAGAGSKRGKAHTARGGGGKKRAGERERQARDAAGTASVSAFFAKR